MVSRHEYRFSLDIGFDRLDCQTLTLVLMLAFLKLSIEMLSVEVMCFVAIVWSILEHALCCVCFNATAAFLLNFKMLKSEKTRHSQSKHKN